MTPPLMTRRFGVWVASAIVVANMIGTGVFTSAGFQAADLHDAWTMISTWVVGGVLALCGAAAYAELGTRIPQAGGEYVYLRETYHPALGFMSGWVSLTAGFSAPIAAAALAFAKYVAALAPGVASAGSQKAVAIALILVVTSLHAFDSVVGGRVQTALTAAKVGLIAIFIFAGFAIGTGDWQHFSASHGGLTQNLPTTSYAIALMYVMFAYSGWNAASYIAGEIKAPHRNLPRALLLGTGLVMLLYVGLNVVFIYGVGPAQLGNFNGKGPVFEVGDVAGHALFGARIGNALTTLIALALISTVSAMVMAGPRVYAAMARDRALPAPLASTNRRGVPTVAIAVQAVLGIGFVLLGTADQLMRYVGFWLALFSALTVGAVFVLRRRDAQQRIDTVGAPNVDADAADSDASHRYRTIGYPVTPLAFIAVSLWIAYAQLKNALHHHPVEVALAAGTLISGTIAYVVLARRSSPSPK